MSTPNWLKFIFKFLKSKSFASLKVKIYGLAGSALFGLTLTLPPLQIECCPFQLIVKESNQNEYTIMGILFLLFGIFLIYWDKLDNDKEKRLKLKRLELLNDPNVPEKVKERIARKL